MTPALSAPQGAHASTTAPPVRTWRHMLSTRLARLSGKEIGEVCKCDHTVASRIASGQRGATIEEWCGLLELMGLKIVSADKHCIAADELRMLRRVYTTATARDLLWEDPE